MLLGKWTGTQKLQAAGNLWLNAASVFTAYLGRAASFSKDKLGIGSLSSMFRLQSTSNSLTCLPLEKNGSDLKLSRICKCITILEEHLSKSL